MCEGFAFRFRSAPPRRLAFRRALWADYAVASRSVSQTMRFMLQVRLARPIFTFALANPMVRMTSAIGPLCLARTCSTPARPLDFFPLALAMASGIGLPFGFLRWRAAQAVPGQMLFVLRRAVGRVRPYVAGGVLLVDQAWQLRPIM